MDTRRQDRETLGFYRARLEDADALYSIPMDSMDRASNIQRLKDPSVYVFFNTAEDAMVVYEPSWGDIPWFSGHVWTSKTGRGRKLRDLFWGTGIWIFENTEAEVITGVVREDMRYYKLFLGHVGATRRTEVLGTAMYTWDKTQVQEFKTKLEATKAPKET